MDVDVTKLMDALDNETNENILHLSSRKILELNLKILKQLHLDKTTTLDYLKRLNGYKYVDEINDLRYGGYIRWVKITDPSNLPLNQCGIVCDIIITDDGICIVCKNFMHRHYRIKMDECLIFQKLSSQELIILSALDHLGKPVSKGLKRDLKQESESESDLDQDSESESESDLDQDSVSDS